LARRWPDLVAALGERTPMVINAYPAALGNFDYAVYVDTYLSTNVASRALQLAARERRSTFLLGQPLFLAEILVRHRRAELPLPHLLVAVVGGYVCPASLESAIRLLVGATTQFEMLQGYGVAEVDAGLLIGRHRTADGEVIFEPRSDAIIECGNDGQLLLGISGRDGQPQIRGFNTGDFVEALPGGGYRIRNGETRLRREVVALLACWTETDWYRRTGYLNRVDGVVQLREGEEPKVEKELKFHEFAARFGASWITKPVWR
jgi:hypothetical protein